MNVSRLIRGFRSLARAPEVFQCYRQCDEWPKITAGYLGLRTLDFPIEFRTPFGDSMTLETYFDLVTAWILFYRREYHVSPQSTTIVDAGANIGAFTLLAARIAPQARIIALEPFPDTMTRLRRHVERNQLLPRVACRSWALAKCEGERFMDDSCHISQSRGLLSENVGDRGLAVECLTIAKVLRDEQIEKLDLLKMDIEGAEHEVLPVTPAEVLRRIRTIALEYHPNGSKAKLFECLLSTGFRLEHDAPTLGVPDSGVAHFSRT